MREINKKVYDVAGFDFDELEFEDGPPPIDGIVLDNSNHSIDQILTDQQVQGTSEDDYNEEDFEAGALTLDKKAQRLVKRSGTQPIKAGGTRTNLSINRDQVSSQESKSKKTIKSSKASVKKRPIRSKKSKKNSSGNNQALMIILILILGAAAYMYMEGMI